MSWVIYAISKNIPIVDLSEGAIFLRSRKNSMNRIRIPIFESRKLISNHNLTFASVFSSSDHRVFFVCFCSYF